MLIDDYNFRSRQHTTHGIVGSPVSHSVSPGQQALTRGKFLGERLDVVICRCGPPMRRTSRSRARSA